MPANEALAPCRFIGHALIFGERIRCFPGGLSELPLRHEVGGLMAATFRIVSLCGSAGALDGYVEIVHATPADSGMAFVVLTHRRSGSPSQLIEILSRVTTMPVQEIEHGTILLPNCVYVAPPGMDVTTDGERFQVMPCSKSYGLPNTFDIYLRSLALNTRDRALTVILSGMAADGSASLGELKASGGMNYTERGAIADGMPRNAVATGHVHYEGTPAQIIASILILRRVHSAMNLTIPSPLIARDRFRSLEDQIEPRKSARSVENLI